jgi:hypothetical protein
MQVTFKIGAQIAGSKGWNKGDVVDSSEIPGGYLASWLGSGICVAAEESPAPEAAPTPPHEEHQ